MSSTRTRVSDWLLEAQAAEKPCNPRSKSSDTTNQRVAMSREYRKTP